MIKLEVLFILLKKEGILDFIQPNTILLWKKRKLSSFISEVKKNGKEDNWFDFKLNICGPAKETCKDFAAMANMNGGYLFYGINDQNFEIKGCDSTLDVNKRITDLLEPNILNPVVHWNIIKTIPLRNGKNVFIVHINESLLIHKPHFVSGTVYIREKGSSRPIKHLSEFRHFFLELKNFQPGHIQNLTNIIEWIKSNDYRWMGLDCFSIVYFNHLKNYLNKLVSQIEGEKQKKIQYLISSLKQITIFLANIETTRSTQITNGQSFFTSSGPKDLQLIDNLEKEINIFLKTFQEVMDE